MDKEKIRKIDLKPFNPNWKNKFELESQKIKIILKDNLIGIHHIGSTAINGIYAKDVIDILPIVRDISKMDALNSYFENLGYVCLGEFGIKNRRFFYKDINGKRSFHIHLFEEGSKEIIRHIKFRDFLSQNSDYALSYSEIKKQLAKEFPNDIEAYLDAKDPFIRLIDYKNNTAKDDQLNAKDDIFLTVFNPNWKKWAKAEINAIKVIAANNDLFIDQIKHLGSTSIENIKAKPVLDIFILLKQHDQLNKWIKILESFGYVFWYENPDKTHHRFFKGMPPFGEKRTHHIHILENEEDFKCRVLFRDKLIKNKKLLKEYEDLKIELSDKYQNDREKYTDLKTEFIKLVLNL